MSDDRLSICARTIYPGFTLDIDETVEASGVTALFGPSGGGKTTLLRLIAGFEKPLSGRIAFGGAAWFDDRTRANIPAHRRPVGFMFQDGRLFPHLSVRGNLDYADTRCRRRGERYSLDDIVAAFDLAGLLDRRPLSLSGGERQRAALARTLLTRPDLLLLDEPLAALDRARKREILPYLEDLPQKFGAPTIYVSHDIEEVSRLADKVMVLAGGRVEACGSAADVIGRIDLEPLTGRFEASSILEGRVARHDQRLRLTEIDVGGASIAMPMNDRLAPGAPVRLRIRARDVAVAVERPHSLSIRNIIPGAVSEIKEDEATAFAEIFIDIGAGRLRARITRASLEDLGLAPALPVYALIKSVSFYDRLT